MFSKDFTNCVHVCIERLVSFIWGYVSDGFQQAAVVEPVDPFEGFPFDPTPLDVA